MAARFFFTANLYIYKHSRPPQPSFSLSTEAPRSDRLHVGALMMPRRVQRLAGGFRFQEILFVSLFDPRVAGSQQEALGVFEVNKLLQKIE